MQELADELPDHSPRFVLLSYPLTLVSVLHGHCSFILANVRLALRTAQRAVRPYILPTCDLQCGEPHALCRRERVDEEYGGGWEGD